MLHASLSALGITTSALLVIAALLHALPRLGQAGRAVGRWLCHAPGLDLLVTLFTVAPLILCPIRWGWGGLLGGFVGQYAALTLWTIAHEFAHRAARRGPKLYKVSHRIIGTWQNFLALWLTSLAAPTFWVIRVTELVVYPGVARLTNFPTYRQREWVNVSRQKFEGLVGHDLIWCLYCDWMTGVWSLGGEMLRNVETFWCPIRFIDGKKCENCKLDYPDIDGGWTRSDGNIGDAVQTLVDHYEAEPRPAKNAWFGHPVRLTVRGRDPARG